MEKFVLSEIILKALAILSTQMDTFFFTNTNDFTEIEKKIVKKNININSVSYGSRSQLFVAVGWEVSDQEKNLLMIMTNEEGKGLEIIESEIINYI